jgi:hypothetical protein
MSLLVGSEALADAFNYQKILDQLFSSVKEALSGVDLA